MIGRSETDVLIMCTDAGINASMMVFLSWETSERRTKIRIRIQHWES